MLIDKKKINKKIKKEKPSPSFLLGVLPAAPSLLFVLFKYHF